MLIAYINEAQNPNWQVPRTPGGPDTESRQNSHKNPAKLHALVKSAAYEIEGRNIFWENKFLPNFTARGLRTNLFFFFFSQFDPLG